MADPDAPLLISGDLDAIVARGRGRLRGWAAKQALQTAFSQASFAALPVPCLALAAALVGLAAAPVWPLGGVATVVAALLAPLVIVAVLALVVYLRSDIDRRACLALYDQLLDFKGRLQAADEFLRAGSPGGFEQAAIEDAAPFARRALATPLPEVRTQPVALRADRWPLAAAAAAMLAVALLLGGFAPAAAMGEPDAGDALAAELAIDAEELTAEETAEPPVDKAATRRALDGRRLAAAPRDAERQAEQEAVRRSASGTGDARPSASNSNAAASRAGRGGQAAGGASSEGESPRAESRPQPPRKRTNERQPANDKDDEPKPSKGVSGGSGRSSGSRTSASDLPAADNKASNDEAEGDSTDDAEDEEDEQQQSASSQKPGLNQRKAPADRSLTPSGLSDQENPLASGRGGPSGLKKTRGVAAMLLGVPMPDHLRGKSNPGRVKVQRERADPEAKASLAAVAAERGVRGESVGHLPRHALEPWQKNAVREYFLAQRRRDAESLRDSVTESRSDSAPTRTGNLTTN